MQRETRPRRFIRNVMGFVFTSTSEAGIPVSPGFRRTTAFTCTKAPSPDFRCVPHSKFMMMMTMMILGTKVSLSTNARHMLSRFRLPVNFRTSADVRTESSPQFVTFRLFSPSPTQSCYATEFIGCATPEKQIQTLLQSLLDVSTLYQMILDGKEASGYGEGRSISQLFRFESGSVDALFSFWIPFPTTRQSTDGTLFGFSWQIYKIRELPRLSPLVPQ